MKQNIVNRYYNAMLASRYLCQAASDYSGINYLVSTQYGEGGIRRLELGNGLDLSCWDMVSAEGLYLENLQSKQEVLEIIYFGSSLYN